MLSLRFCVSETVTAGLTTYLRHFSVSVCLTSSMVMPRTENGSNSGTEILPSGGTTTCADRLGTLMTLMLRPSSGASTYGAGAVLAGGSAPFAGSMPAGPRSSPNASVSFTARENIVLSVFHLTPRPPSLLAHTSLGSLGGGPNHCRADPGSGGTRLLLSSSPHPLPLSHAAGEGRLGFCSPFSFVGRRAGEEGRTRLLGSPPLFLWEGWGP